MQPAGRDFELRVREKWVELSGISWPAGNLDLLVQLHVSFTTGSDIITDHAVKQHRPTPTLRASILSWHAPKSSVHLVLLLCPRLIEIWKLPGNFNLSIL
jgi:hypothetical protein